MTDDLTVSHYLKDLLKNWELFQRFRPLPGIKWAAGLGAKKECTGQVKL